MSGPAHFPRKWQALPAIGAVVLVLITSRYRSPKPRPVPHLAAIDAPFPHLALAALPGTSPLTDADLRAGHVTLVNLFASWCLPCRVEAPQLAALRDDGIAVAGIAVRDDPANTAAFLATTGTHFKHIGLDPRERVQPALSSAGIPETWLVDGHGIVRARFRGDIHAEDLPRVRAAVAAAR